MDGDAGEHKFLCKALKEPWCWRLFHLFKTNCLILTVVILDTFSIKLLTVSLKVWEGVMNSLSYLIL